MSLPYNSVKASFLREINDGIGRRFQRSAHVTPDLIRRLGLEAELKGHDGCVNCLSWNERGTLLASGSDDLHVIIWNAFQHKSISTFRTAHTGNIFSVKFLPDTGDTLLVSGAADCKIDVRDVNTSESLHVFSCHNDRVKRLATAPQQPSIFWSASEDGTIMQFDLRDPESCKSEPARNVLVDLNAELGVRAEAKCLSINQLRPELLAVGANDPYVRLYDRRMLHCQTLSMPSTQSHDINGWFIHRRHLFHSSTVDQESTTPTTTIHGRRSPSPMTTSRNSSVTHHRSSSSSTASTAYSDQYSRLPRGCVRYFVAGHLPRKRQDYRRKHRTLACTYLTFSPDGCEVLVNLGGEQIYLFDINKTRRVLTFDTTAGAARPDAGSDRDSYDTDHAQRQQHGNTATPTNADHAHIHCGSGSTNGLTKHVLSEQRSSSLFSAPSLADEQKKNVRKAQYYGKPLPPAVEELKQRANAVFEKEQYNQAILLYNQAICMAPSLPILYGNRAAAFLKRNWDGDVYAALRDCYAAMQLDDCHIKAHFRLAKCLYELSRLDEALNCLQQFKEKFPDYSTSQTCLYLEKDIRAAIYSRTTDTITPCTDKSESRKNKADTSPSSPHSSSSSSSTGERRKEEEEEEEEEEDEQWRDEASDYELRYCGHCNTTTDIKEANYFGSNGQYIVAGSDDGSFFIWDKQTTNIVRVLRGDESIVNCLEPHPTTCLLATSGIDRVVRLWTPRPDDGKKDVREVDNCDDAATANQKRMNADPLEMMLMNMGYRLSAAVARGGGVNMGEEEEEESGEGREEGSQEHSTGGITQCRSS